MEIPLPASLSPVVDVSDTDPLPGVSCPICNGTKFKPHRDRGRVKGATCASFPRTRMAWLLIEHVVKLRPDARIAHFAPEPPVARLLTERHGVGYEAYDLDPSRERWVNEPFPVHRLDLCADLHKLEDASYDLVMHHHVIEHLPCNETVVLQRLQAKVKPGGYHIFSLPIREGAYYRSDVDPRLTDEKRASRFGQSNHLRRFGVLDFDQTLGMVFDIPTDYDVTSYLDDEMLSAAHVLPRQRIIGGGTVFILDSEGKAAAV